MIMFKMAECRILVVWAFVVLYIADISSAVDVSNTNCTTGGTGCNAIHNASCGTGLKCKCDPGYKETTTTCTAIAGLSATCGASSDCASVTNAVCDTTCKCSIGYKTNGATCVLVYGTVCKGTAICGGLANSACTGGKCACAAGYVKNSNICSLRIYGKTCSDNGGCAGLDHSACPRGKCACADGYEENNNICSQAVSSTTCTSDGDECDTIDNAQCDTSLHKCKCDQGYKENKDACEAIESGAVSMKSAVGLVFGSVILLLIQAL